MSKTPFASNEILNRYNGTSPAFFVGFSTTNPENPGPTEPIGNGYARAPMAGTLGTPGVPFIQTIRNIAEISTPLSTAAWLDGADLLFWFVADAAIGGNVHRWDWLGKQGSTNRPFQGSGINPANSQITVPEHGFLSGDSVLFQGSGLPVQLPTNTRFWVQTIDGDTIVPHQNASLTSPVLFDNTAAGSLTAVKIVPRRITGAGDRIYFPTSSLTLIER